MKESLEISNTISLPLDAVTQTLACIGRRGTGKTYLATKIAEEMLDAQAQIIVLDPVGPWFGLRVGADGKSKGKEIFVIGGERGDVPVTPEAGARIARLLVEKSVSAVLDISGFRQGERKRFSADFAEEFFHLKKTQRSAVHLFIEEAQVFIPQRPGPDEARMLGAFEMIIRLGRNYGVGATIITQRPQSVNKEVLSQVECLCVLQVNGTHERKALDEWVQEAGADRKLVNELPGLSRGEGYVWSPAWLRTFQRVRFSKKTTFDASATPEVGRAAKAAMLSSVDVEALKADLHEVIAEAEKYDPKALRRRIAELERAPNPDVVLKLEQRIAELDRAARAFSQQADAYSNHGRTLAKLCDARNAALSDAADKLAEIAIDLRMHVSGENLADQVPATDPGMVAYQKGFESQVALADISLPRRTERPAPSGDLGSGHMKILAALAKLRAVGVTSPARIQVALFSGYSNAKSGGFAGPMAELVARGLAQGGNGAVAISPEGLKAAGPVSAPASNRELHEQLRDLLGGAEWKMLELLIHHYPKAVTRTDLAERTGYSNAKSGGFAGPLARLTSLGLAEVPAPGEVRGSGLLFIR